MGIAEEQVTLLEKIVRQTTMQTQLQALSAGLLVDLLAKDMPTKEQKEFTLAQARRIAKIAGYTDEEFEAAVNESGVKS